LLLVLLLGAVGARTARYVINGQVLGGNNEGLHGATVHLLNTVLGTTSNANGRDELAAAGASSSPRLGW